MPIDEENLRIILNEIGHFHDDITKILASSFLRRFSSIREKLFENLVGSLKKLSRKAGGKSQSGQ